MDLHGILKRYWGYDEFRPLQEDIIRSVLEGHDTLGLMPTGGGKSITFQVPGLYYDAGLTVVITPLVSLMKDQVDNLKKRHIKAACLHSGMSARETRLAWEKIVNGGARFLYVSPERLGNDRFMLEMRNLDIRLIVVDEAHCISQWGYDFRPSYLNIKDLRKVKPDVAVLALTATATPEVAEDISRQLQFRDARVFRKSFVRDNISYLVRPSESKIHDVFHILSRTTGSSIVYVRSRRRSKDISEYLESFGISSTFYHAGLDSRVKEERQNLWQRGDVRVMVATNAFGMGIDKPDVRVVIHYDIPSSLEEYYQEAGRAGRDGLNSYAVLLASKNDPGVLRRRVTEAFPPRDVIKETYEHVCNFLRVSVGEGYDEVRQFDIMKFCRLFKIQEKQCRASLNLLHKAGYLQFIETTDSRSRMKMVCNREDLYHITDLTKTTERVLSMCMRLYTGLFSDYVYIWEPEIATSLAISEKDVYESMLELSRRKVISYIPRSDLPVIYFPTSREERSALLIGITIYEDRKKILSRRTEAMIDYAFSSSGCRVSRMLSYFGEEDPHDCRRCDVCRERNGKTGKKVDDVGETASEVMEFLRIYESGATLQMIIAHVHRDSDTIARALSFLCNEGFIEVENQIYRHT